MLKISLKFVPKVRIINIPAFFSRSQAIIWTDDGQITNSYMRYSASMS